MPGLQLVSPVRVLLSVGPEHPTEGLTGFPAHDWFSVAGSSVLAPADGRIFKLSGHPVAQGPISGPHGPFGLSLYIVDHAGNMWYLTHLATRAVRLGNEVKRGTVVGTVADYAKYGTPCHVHQGVHVAGAPSAAT